MKKRVDKNHKHPVLKAKLTFGQKAADHLSQFAGSWTFISLFFAFLGCWILLNAYLLVQDPFDPFPFILLNLLLSTLAATQAPVILMAQNRQAERDRIHANYDYQVNRKAEREIQVIQKELAVIRRLLEK